MTTKTKNPTSSRMLTATQLLSPGSTRKVEIEELDGYIWVRQDFPAGAIMDMQQAQPNTADHSNALMRLIASVVVDEDGNSLFDGATIEELRQMNIKTYGALANAVVGEAKTQGLLVDSGDDTSAKNV